MDDRSISEVISALDFVGGNGERALDWLYREWLTWPSIARTATPEIETVGRTLGAAFVRHYRTPQGQAECR